MSAADEKTDEPSAQAVLLRMAEGYIEAKALQVAAELGIADLIEETPKTADQLAKIVGVHADSLYRLLRALASAGIFKERDDCRFENTPLSEAIRADVAGSVRDSVIMRPMDALLLASSKLMDVVRTGRPSFEDVNGCHQYEYFQRHPDIGEIFNRGMSARTSQVTSALLQSYDFSQFKTLIDVGGGVGTVLATILNEFPHLHGCLYEQNAVIEGARSFLEAQGVTNRCELISGDFLESVPKDFDAYLLKSILHDWDDEKALTILKNCRASMKKNGRLLIVNAVISRDNAPHPAKWKDLMMMVVHGSKERTEREFQKLLGDAGFELKQVTALPLPDALIEAVPV